MPRDFFDVKKKCAMAQKSLTNTELETFKQMYLYTTFIAHEARTAFHADCILTLGSETSLRLAVPSSAPTFFPDSPS